VRFGLNFDKDTYFTPNNCRILTLRRQKTHSKDTS
jgi:hypothetical protein